MKCSSKFFKLLCTITQLLGTVLSWISCMYFQFVLRSSGKMFCDKSFKSHMNKYLISVASRQATKMSVGELIIKLFASSS